MCSYDYIIKYTVVTISNVTMQDGMTRSDLLSVFTSITLVGLVLESVGEGAAVIMVLVVVPLLVTAVTGV